MKNTIWIVDGAYLMKGAPGKFDYVKLKESIIKINGCGLYEAYYLNSTPNPATDQQDSFHSWLKLAEPKGPKMRVLLYKLKDMNCVCPSCGHNFSRQVQKGVDVSIATLLIKLAALNKYDRVILSAGDGDFESAIEYIKDDLKKEFWLTGFDNSVSADLQSYADKIIWLNDIWDEIKK